MLAQNIPLLLTADNDIRFC